MISHGTKDDSCGTKMTVHGTNNDFHGAKMIPHGMKDNIPCDHDHGLWDKIVVYRMMDMCQNSLGLIAYYVKFISTTV